MARTNLTTYLPGLAHFMEGRKTVYVAEKLEIDQSALSQLINCKRGASLAMALKLARFLGTSVECLVEDQIADQTASQNP